MTQIESLTLGVTLGSVIDRQSRDESITDDCAGTRRANAACADNPNSRHDSRTILIAPRIVLIGIRHSTLQVMAGPVYANRRMNCAGGRTRAGGSFDAAVRLGMQRTRSWRLSTDRGADGRLEATRYRKIVRSTVGQSLLARLASAKPNADGQPAVIPRRGGVSK